MDLPPLSDPTYQPFWTAVAAIATSVAGFAALATAFASFKAITATHRSSLKVALLTLNEQHLRDLARWYESYGKVERLGDLPPSGQIEAIRLFNQRYKLAQISHEVQFHLEEWDLAADPFDAYMVHKQQSRILRKATTRKFKRNIKRACKRHEAWVADRMRQGLSADPKFLPLRSKSVTHTPTSPPPK